MKNYRAKAINNLWMVKAWREWRCFKKTFQNIEKVQLNLLLSTLYRNKNTEYGRKFDFKSIGSYEDYKQKAPLTTFDDYTDYIDSISSGNDNILTLEKVFLLGPSSGSVAASKLIPYTSSLQKEFNRGILPWIFDLFKNNPELKNGAAYWSNTPLTKNVELTSGGIRIGFAQDSEYLGKIMGKLQNSISAVPDLVKYIPDIASFHYITLYFLLNCRDLRLFSVWNPTFLTILLDYLPKWWDRLLSDIYNGSISAPNSIDLSVKNNLMEFIRPNPGRAKELSKISPHNFKNIWPDLELISCWTDGISDVYAEKLSKDYFPNISIQGKGLIATEAFVSFPLCGYDGCAVAANSHFFEFLPLDSNGNPDIENPKLVHDLQKAKQYAVVVTTSGGLYRYQLCDIIEVSGHISKLPLIRFVGKADNVSDCFGEKLNEKFVSNILDRLFEKWGICPAFFMVAPEKINDDFHYILYLEMKSVQNFSHEMAERDFERELRKNFHYDYCRKLGQIREVNICRVPFGAVEKYLEECRKRGIRLGNIKTTVLQKTGGWRSVLL